MKFVGNKCKHVAEYSQVTTIQPILKKVNHRNLEEINFLINEEINFIFLRNNRKQPSERST